MTSLIPLAPPPFSSCVYMPRRGIISWGRPPAQRSVHDILILVSQHWELSRQGARGVMGAPGDLQHLIPPLICKMRKKRWWTLESEVTQFGILPCGSWL